MHGGRKRGRCICKSIISERNLRKMRHLDLFSGIGGFSVASESVWGEVEHIFCDIEPFSQAILRKHWPNSKIYGDIKELKGKEVGPVDLLTGGFPCQPFSSAGKRRGKEDDRHLWPEMLRVIRETAPRWIVGENVSGLLTWNGGLVLDEVFSDLEAEGYEVWAFVIPACAVGAPHRRDRVWIVAHSDRDTDGGGAGKDESTGRAQGIPERHEVGKPSESGEIRDTSESLFDWTREGNCHKCGGTGTKRWYIKNEKGNAKTIETNCFGCGDYVSYSNDKGLERHRNEESTTITTKPLSTDVRATAWSEDWPSVAARLCTLDDGLPNGLARPRGWRNAALKGAGNAIVPQVAQKILKAIREIECKFYKPMAS